MTGTRLSLLPAAIVAWETFVENFPEGEVMLRPENRFGFKERYDDPPYADYDDIATPRFCSMDPWTAVCLPRRASSPSAKGTLKSPTRTNCSPKSGLSMTGSVAWTSSSSLMRALFRRF